MHFWSPNKVAYGEEKKRKEKIKPRYGCLTLVWKLWILACFWYKNYLSMDC